MYSWNFHFKLGFVTFSVRAAVWFNLLRICPTEVCIIQLNKYILILRLTIFTFAQIYFLFFFSCKVLGQIQFPVQWTNIRILIEPDNFPLLEYFKDTTRFFSRKNNLINPLWVIWRRNIFLIVADRVLYLVFSRTYPSNYWPGSALLNFEREPLWFHPKHSWNWILSCSLERWFILRL